jgi:hypothetical protein
MTVRHATVLLAVLATACGTTDPVTYSAPVGISLDVKSGDAAGGAIRVDKNITTESGNPYGAFVNDAVKALGGYPSRIGVASATLALEPSSTGVTTLQQVFTGTIWLSFEPNGTSTLYPAASAAVPTGAGPVPMQVSFDSTSMIPADYAALVGGNFKVVLIGTPAAGFGSAAATARLQAVLNFVAYP